MRERRSEPSKGLVSQSLSSGRTREREMAHKALGPLLTAQSTFEREREIGSQDCYSNMVEQCLTMFCRETLEYDTFCRETLKYDTLCCKNLDSTLWVKKMANLRCEPTPHFMPLCFQLIFCRFEDTLKKMSRCNFKFTYSTIPDSILSWPNYDRCEKAHEEFLWRWWCFLLRVLWNGSVSTACHHHWSAQRSQGQSDSRIPPQSLWSECWQHCPLELQ